ncbi:MAG: PAC2 family protein [Candidatus Diapherotrites archaeon]|nr:PAC2 family protein [Candidatus Diapherotrites archaeon]
MDNIELNLFLEVFFMSTKIKFLRELKLKNAILFTGLPGIGLVGKIVVDYLLKEIKSEKFGLIYSDSFPPSVHTKDGLIELICDELYYFSHNNQDFVFLSGPVQPSLDYTMASSKQHYEFAQKIVETSVKLGVKEIYTLAGLNVGDSRIGQKPRVVVAATDKKTLEEFTKLGAIINQPEGLISGAAGLILGEGIDAGLRGACLMGETNAKLIYGDPGSAKSLLELLIKKFDFKVKLDRIGKEAKQIEQAFKQLNTKMQEEMKEENPVEGLTYVR